MMLPPSSSRTIRISRSSLEIPSRSCQFCRYPPNAHLVAYWHIADYLSRPAECLLSGVKRTLFPKLHKSANDPKRTLFRALSPISTWPPWRSPRDLESGSPRRHHRRCSCNCIRREDGHGTRNNPETRRDGRTGSDQGQRAGPSMDGRALPDP
jgi:hypothetical protein